MPNLLVTGRWGETHVTSAQARNFHAGVFGSGQYVLSGLTATMTTANTCHIDPGVACFNGADVEVPAGGVDVTIDNGTQGQMRNDLVVLRYTSEPSTQTEDVELVVVKGTPAASSPQDPAHNGGSILEGDSPCDMPLYRIPLNGITVGDPVLLAPAWMAPNRAVVSSADGTPTASAVTATELGYLDGVTSGVQGQIDALGDSLSQRFPSVSQNVGAGKEYNVRLDDVTGTWGGVYLLAIYGTGSDAENAHLYMLNPHMWGAPELVVEVGSYEYQSGHGIGVRFYRDGGGHQRVVVTPEGVGQRVTVGMVAIAFTKSKPTTP